MTTDVIVTSTQSAVVAEVPNQPTVVVTLEQNSANVIIAGTQLGAGGGSGLADGTVVNSALYWDNGLGVWTERTELRFAASLMYPSGVYGLGSSSFPFENLHLADFISNSNPSRYFAMLTSTGAGETAHTFNTYATLLDNDFILSVQSKNVEKFYIDHDGNTWVNGTLDIDGLGTGALDAIDVSVGSANYGMMTLGNSTFGRTSRVTGNMDLDGTVILINKANPATSNILFAMMDGTNSIRFALPQSGVGNATYNPRSMLIAGGAPNDDTCVTVGYWQTNNSIFHNLTCDTDLNGADLGVQNDLEVEGTIWVDELRASTDLSPISFYSAPENLPNEYGFLFKTTSLLTGGEIAVFKNSADQVALGIGGEITNPDLIMHDEMDFKKGASKSFGFNSGTDSFNVLPVIGSFTADNVLGYMWFINNGAGTTWKLDNSFIAYVTTGQAPLDIGSAVYRWNDLYMVGTVDNRDTGGATFSSNVTATGTATAFNFNTLNALTTGDKLISLDNNSVEKFYVDDVGNIVSQGSLNAGGATVEKSGGNVIYGGVDVAGYMQWIDAGGYYYRVFPWSGQIDINPLAGTAGNILYSMGGTPMFSMTIGSIQPRNGVGTMDIGTSSYRWKDIHLDGTYTHGSTASGATFSTAVTASGAAIAYDFDTVNALGVGDYLLSLKNATVEKVRIEYDGTTLIKNHLSVGADVTGPSSNNTLAIQENVTFDPTSNETYAALVINSSVYGSPTAGTKSMTGLNFSPVNNSSASGTGKINLTCANYYMLNIGNLNGGDNIGAFTYTGNFGVGVSNNLYSGKFTTAGNGTNEVAAIYAETLGMSSVTPLVSTIKAIPPSGSPVEGHTILISGDGVSADLCLGADRDASIYWDGTDLVIDPTLVSAGAVKIAGNLNMQSNLITNIDQLQSGVATSGAAIAFELDTANDLNTIGDKLLSVKNNAIEKSFIDKDGSIKCYHLGAGVSSPSSTDILKFIETFSGISGDDIRGISAIVNHTGSPALGNTLRAIYAQCGLSETATDNNSEAIGVYSTVQTITSSNYVKAATIETFLNITGSGAPAIAYGYYGRTSTVKAGTASYGVYLANYGASGIPSTSGIYITKQSGSTVNQGITLAGDGIGADVVFGTANQSYIYKDASDKFTFISGETNGSTSDCFLFDTTAQMIAAGAMLLSVRNQGSEVFTVDKDGDVACTDITGTDATFTGEVKGQKLLLEAADAGTGLSGSNVYLDLHASLPMTAVRGHPMPRAGSITGLACSISISTWTGGDDIQAEVRKNGVVVFSQAASLSATGRVEFSATQARGTDTFAANDLIQMSISTVSGAPVWAAPIMTVEIILDD